VEGHKIVKDDGSRTDLLSSLRSQIISTALEDRKIVAKANNVKVYFPGRKISSTSLRNYYDKIDPKTVVSEEREEEKEFEHELVGELNASLRESLLQLRDEVQQAADEKEAYQHSIVSFVGQQLQHFATMLQKKHSEGGPTTDDSIGSAENLETDLAQELEAQLRSFYGESAL